MSIYHGGTRIAGSNKGIIRDSSTRTDTTWSSSKIAQEIQSARADVSYASLAAVLGENFTNGILTERNLVDVLGATGVQDAFSKLQTKASQGNFSNLGLGDYIDIPSITFDGQTLTHNAAYENLRVQIIAFDYFKNSNNTQHHVVMQFKHCPFVKVMDSGNSNAGGYPMRELAEYLEVTFGQGLETAMGVDCKSVYQYYQVADDTWRYENLQVFLPTENQLIGHKGSSTIATNDQSYEFGQFPYYAINPKGLMKNYNGVLNNYWTASPLFAVSSSFAVVTSHGNVYSDSAKDSGIGVVPVFCI